MKIRNVILLLIAALIAVACPGQPAKQQSPAAEPIGKRQFTATTPPPACPDGMVHVVGKYCLTLRHDCLKSFVEDPLDKKWEDSCIEYKEESAQCLMHRQGLSFTILPDGVLPQKYAQIAATSHLGRQLVGRKPGDTVLGGCLIERVSGISRSEVKPGTVVHLDCAPELERDFCIDEYEAPNRPGGEVWHHGYVSFREANAACEAEGKRLCDADEWTLACEGPERLPYPYGWKRDNAACNVSRCMGSCEPDNLSADGKNCTQFDRAENAVVTRPMCLPEPDWLLEQATYDMDRSIIDAAIDHINEGPVAVGDDEALFLPSGARERCVSPYGVRDMPGNIDEWSQCFNTCDTYPSNTTGGHSMINVRNRCRPKTTGHGPDYKAYFISYRCCADPLAE
jgi:hypothetical protein